MKKRDRVGKRRSQKSSKRSRGVRRGRRTPKKPLLGGTLNFLEELFQTPGPANSGVEPAGDPIARGPRASG